MNIVLWIVQILLAAAFLAHGLMMLMPSPEIAALLDAALPKWFQLFIGVSEVAAAIGLTLPGLTRTLPGLVAWAATGVAFVSISATIYHIVRAEYSSAGITLLLFALSAYVAYMRFVKLPIAARRVA